MDKREKNKIEKLFEGRGERERRDSREEMLKRKREKMDKNWEKEEKICKKSNRRRDRQIGRGK